MQKNSGTETPCREQGRRAGKSSHAQDRDRRLQAKLPDGFTIGFSKAARKSPGAAALQADAGSGGVVFPLTQQHIADGLGLSLVRRICVSQSWSVELTAMEPSGCRFQVVLASPPAGF